MSEQAEQWLAFANDDVRVAEIVLREGIYTQACFHCQQCVEKVFKAILVYQGRTVPRIHSIVTRSQLMPADIVSKISGDVSIFDDYYMPVRYPDTLPGGLPDGPPGVQEATEALGLAKDIFSIAKDYVTT